MKRVVRDEQHTLFQVDYDSGYNSIALRVFPKACEKLPLSEVIHLNRKEARSLVNSLKAQLKRMPR